MTGGFREPADSDALALQGVPAVGEVIESKYEIESVLGIGGMGVVVAARHLQLGQRVAIKFMRGITGEDRVAVSRFLREARAAVALSSEHVTKVLDVGTLPTGIPYMVMEHLSGIDLGEVLRQYGRMAISDAVNAVLQACEAIAEAHAMGIVHRDLKPANLFVTQRMDGSPLVKVLDFGISKTSDFDRAVGRVTLTPTGYIMGSPAYMSPEQVRSAKAVDARTDIWALGVILYEALTAIAPFTGETVGETLARIVSESPPPITSMRPDVPEGLAAVVAQCLERGLEQRIRTVGELATKLSPYAPRESLISVERIVRISGGIGAGGQSSQASPGAPSPSGAARLETGPQWVRSRPTQPLPPQTSRGSLLAGAAVGLAMAATGVGIYALTGNRANRTASGAESSVGAPEALPAIAPPANAVDPASPVETAEPAQPIRPAVAVGEPARREQANVDAVEAVAAVDAGADPRGRTSKGRPEKGGTNRASFPASRPSPKPTEDNGLDRLLERRQ